jgi:hypothetical protein
MLNPQDFSEEIFSSTAHVGITSVLCSCARPCRNDVVPALQRVHFSRNRHGKCTRCEVDGHQAGDVRR